MYNYLTDAALDALIDAALAEDLGPDHLDHTSYATLTASQIGEAHCLMKESGRVAGIRFAQRVYQKMDGVRVDVQKMDGEQVQPGDILFRAAGSVRSLLMGERLVLNVLQRMSGIATQTHRVVQALEGTGCRVLDTRKTTPLIRTLEKWAVVIGGGVNHRYGLFDMILIKDNHIDACGGIQPALAHARAYLLAKGLTLDVEIETRSLEEVQQVLDAGGADRILLDNMPLHTLRQAVARIGGRIPTEASGGITPENARSYAETGVDFISMGALTHSVKSLDISLKIRC
ncbi:MAG: carboxylating nicotinate-nucleotide diphosphorylase [Bacteroidetes bacterium]|jgi:nicotinate-nucleotide pyrophosphorylase (carboxylating)|nr:carboxylating nicotinate-nucleotide diphosphorylase [Bacteroidota bacterium]